MTLTAPVSQNAAPRRDPSRSSRAAVVAARLLAVVATLAAVAAIVLPLATGGEWLPALFRTPEPIIAPSFAVAGAVLAGSAEARRLGWMLLVVACSAAAYVLATSLVAWEPSPLAEWFRAWVWLPALLTTTVVLPQVVPYGRSLGGPWHRVAVTGGVFTVAASVGTAVIAGTSARLDPFSTPLFVVPLLILVAAGIASVVVRVRRGGPEQRRQLGWVGFGLLIAVVATFTAPAWAVAIAVLGLPIGLAVAAMRYRLYDLDLVVGRALVGVALLAVSALVYAAVTGWAGALFGAASPVTGFAAAFTVALLFHPLYQVARRAVERLFRGRRPDPQELRRRVTRAVHDARGPAEALSAGVAEVARSLGSPSVAVEVPLPGAPPVVVEAAGGGGTSGQPVELPLHLHGEEVGRLRLVPRGRGVLPPPDRIALAEMAEALTAPAYAVRLASAVEASRTELLGAREDERRRLRRDLHDGLGPQLAAAVMTLDTAAAALGRRDAERAGKLVTAGREDLAEAVRDVRRLVEGLRPPSLDDLGLVETLRAGAAALGRRGEGAGPEIAVVSDALPQLPAAVEVAALRIAQEAMLNAVRHASASRIDVELRIGPGTLEVEVTDDGRGIPLDVSRGVGLGSMRERAAELGGTCTIAPAEDRGTRVLAALPLEGSR